MLGAIKKATRNLVGNVLSHLGTNKRVVHFGDEQDTALPYDPIVLDDPYTGVRPLPSELRGASNRAQRRGARHSMRSRKTIAVRFHVKRSGNFNTTRIVHQSMSDKGFQYACNPLLQALLNKLPIYSTPNHVYGGSRFTQVQ